LDLEVKIININEGKNEVIVTRCKKLYEYSIFIAKAHSFWKELGNLKEGIKAAIKYCQKHDILREFLKIHGREVLNMLYMEWNLEDAIAYAREESREDGRKEGREEVRIELAKKDKELADKDKELADIIAENARLRAQLELK